MTLARPLALGLGATALTHLAAAALFPIPPRWDGFFYHQHAQRLAAGLGYVDLGTGRPTAFYPVGYAAALSLPLRLGLGPFAAVVALNLVAGFIATAAVVLAVDERNAHRAALMAALYPGLALWSCAAMSESITAALLVAALAFALRRQTFAAGALVGLATLVRPPSLLALAALAIAAPSGRRLRTLASAALAVACVVAPWTARNARVLDAPALVSTNAGSNLLIGTLDAAHGGYHRPDAGPACRDLHGEVTRDRCLRDVALRRIAAAPHRWALHGLVKLARTFAWEQDPVGYLRAPDAPRRPRDLALAALCTVAWWWLVLRTWRGARRDDPTTRAVVITAATLVAAHFVFLGADRYHLVLVPTLVLLAARAP